jgi:hypothetical protein
MKPITSLAVGAVMIPIGLVIGLGWVPLSAADLATYSGATACTTPNIAARTCWTEVPATVSTTQIFYKSRGNSDWHVWLTD